MQVDTETDICIQEEDETSILASDVIEVKKGNVGGKRYINFTPEIELVLFNSVIHNNPFPRGASKRWMDVSLEVKRSIIDSGNASIADGPYPSEYKCKRHVLHEAKSFKKLDNQNRRSTGTDNEVYDERRRLLNEISILIQETDLSQKNSSTEALRRQQLLQEGQDIREAATRTETRKRTRSPVNESTGENRPKKKLPIETVLDTLDKRYMYEDKRFQAELKFKREESRKNRKLKKRRIRSDNHLMIQMREMQEKTLSEMRIMQSEVTEYLKESQRELVSEIGKAFTNINRVNK